MGLYDDERSEPACDTRDGAVPGSDDAVWRGRSVSHTRRQSTSTCWECDAIGVWTTVVTLRIGEAGEVSLALCDECLWKHWQPLVEEGAAAPDDAR
jgi:hypothetical protein